MMDLGALTLVCTVGSFVILLLAALDVIQL